MSKRSIRIKMIGSIAGLALVASACGSDKSDAATPKEVVDHYAAGVQSTYDMSLKSAKVMDGAIDKFVADPSDANFREAKRQWLLARTDYGRTEAFRFYGGPIDNDETGPEGQINAWPLDEVYIDYVEGNPNAGIINNVAAYPTINTETLTAANEKDGETNISTGWHAIEFLLWGQDLSVDGPGARPVTDYTTLTNADRRKTYLSTASDLLISDLTEVADAWKPNADNYRKEFVALDSTEALRRMITGLGELSRGELVGERMDVAFLNHSQEDEHSCFSDNTTADLVANADGIRMVVEGDYDGIPDGPGIDDLVIEKDKKLGEQLRNEVNASVSDTMAIPAPFDKSLVPGLSDDDPGRMAIKKAEDALDAQTDSLVAGAKAIGVTISVS